MNMFAKAKKAETTTAKPKKGEKAVINIEGLQDYASVVATIQALEAVKATMESEVKAQVFTKFYEQGAEKMVRPENFKGVDGDASASCELRKRSTVSALTAEEVAMFEKAGVEVGTEVSVQAAFIINPAYTNNSELLEKVSKRLEGVKDLPSDFIIYQEEKSKKVVTDTTIAQLFQKPKEIMINLLKAATLIALKPKMESETGLETAVENVKTILLG